MKPEVQVQNALRALADQDRSLESQTPAHAIFARRQPASHWKTGAAFAAIALAAAAALILSLRPSPQPIERPTPIVTSAATPIPELVPATTPKPVRRAKRPAPIAAEPREVVTEFYPLMDAPPPFERGQLLRVVVPASTMRSVGLPISPERWSERVQADVLVGEEGMARAIRFVSYEQ
jgi:hypothetical protein